TLHRPSNVDDMEKFEQIIAAFEHIEKDTKLVFPIHPRTRNNISKNGLDKRVKAMKNLMLIEPVGYLDFLCLMSNAQLMMTDSGGIQEETTILGIPCLTLRENTERPVTITEGTNRLVHITTDDILKHYAEIKNNGQTTDDMKIPNLWDGKASDRIAAIIADTPDLKYDESMNE
ncbi:UDP-N-acetylglucosamine 2-epimerase, partial [Candidatus Pacearchaeota archaeon]|nr:UDP-N-acetylglucosamine 2-epimerase [Candidatus Pacearchaeota archaeon]